ncbi:MAG: HEAT repeat domain-containing protein [Pirellulaceae bacterium]|nr:HEAT repeat domain-containing protein [Pirellulaceae bacterium]
MALFSRPTLAQRDLRDIPKPDPAAELAAMQFGDGFEVNLFASDPMFAKPIHMNFDERGRLWIASSRNYPQIEPGAAPTDQIVVLEDRNRDGVADHHVVFADDLLIPTGVLPGDGGVYVAASTELIHLKDTDGDGRADQRRTILSGFGTEDTHHLLHTLRWAPDGWMHLNQSIYIHSHVETPQGVQRLDGGGIWRFDPTTSALQVFCKGFVNPWGHAIDDYGQSLVTDGAYFEGINYAFPESVFVTSPGATRWLAGLNPGSPKHCGLEIISGGAMPTEMQGRLVTNDFRSHRVCLFEIARQGSGYRSAQLPELIRTQHIAFRPIDVKMGPDGAIYIADWYNPIIQHGEVDFRDPRRDTEHGRIWRITAKGKQPLVPPRYDQLKEESLCTLLRDSALWVRQFARMELARRQRTKREAALDDFIGSAKHPEERSLRKLESLWVKLCAREVDAALIDTLRQDDDARIRALAIRTISRLRHELPAATLWLTEAARDSDDQVVLEAVTGLGQLKTLPAVEQLLNVAARPDQDQFLKFALWNAVRSNESIWLESLQTNQLAVRDDLAKLRLLADAATQAAVARPLLNLLRTGQTAQSVTGSVVELVAEKAASDTLGDLVDWITAPNSSSSLSARTSYLETVTRLTLARNIKPDRVDAILSTTLDRALNRSESDVPPSVNTGAAGDAAVQIAYVAQLIELAGNWQCVACAPKIVQWLSRAEVAGDSQLLTRGLAALARLPDDDSRALIRQRALDAQSPASKRAAALAALNIFDSRAAAEDTLRFFIEQ